MGDWIEQDIFLPKSFDALLIKDIHITDAPSSPSRDRHRLMALLSPISTGGTVIVAKFDNCGGTLVPDLKRIKESRLLKPWPLPGLPDCVEIFTKCW